jgi:hypothetical protein
MSNSNSKRLQMRFSKLLLDLAERTQWKWGPFGELSSIRADQRRNVENYASGRGIPKSVNIRVETLTLVELISSENLIPFKEAIASVLPEIRHDSADFEESYRSIVEGSFSGGSMHVGRIARSDPYPGAGTVSKSDSLPPSVRLLDLEIRKVFSSLAFLYITAHLDRHVTDEIVEKIRNPALPVFRITKLSVKNPWILGWRLGPVDVPREVAGLLTDIGSDINAFLGIDRIREATERFSARQVRPIVTYSATGGPADRDQIKPWLAENEAWLSALGIEAMPFLLFTDGSSVFAWSSSSRSSEYRLPHHVLTFRNLCENEWYRMSRHAVRSVAPAMGILDWAESSIHSVEEVRNAAFTLIRSRNPRSRKSLRRYFRLNEVVQLQMMSVEQFANQISEEFATALTEAGAGKFALVDPDMEKFIGANLADAIVASVNRFLKVLRAQASYVHRMFSEFMSMRNMEASFGIQRLVVLLTVITLLVSLPTLFPVLKAIGKYLFSVFPRK